MKNIYRDYYNLPFTRIYWSKLENLIIRNGRYVCACCGGYPTQCKNKKSAEEYKKIKSIFEMEYQLFGVADMDVPIRQTGYVRADNNFGASLIWKVQRELAKRAGFVLIRSSFM